MMGLVLRESLAAWWPETLLGGGALLVFLLSGWRGGRLAIAAAWAALLVSASALWAAPGPPSAEVFYGLIVCDPFSLVFRWLALGTTALTILLLMGSREIPVSARGESLGLVLCVGLGLMLMAEANHLLTAYLAMELVSLSAYVLVGFLPDARSAEASLKYLLFGALASGLMLFGMSLLFGLTGQLGFPGLRQALGGLPASSWGPLGVALALLLAGLAYKISMAPFHQWTPDVYEGAPVPVTALLSVGPKAAGLALFLRLAEALRPAWPDVSAALVVLTIVTMTLGNLVALAQTNLKRLLAYSTIGQVGYLLIGVVVDSQMGRQALLLYLVAYLFMNLGVFACVIAVIHDTGTESLEAFRGLAKRAPGLALMGTVCLLSLAGIPPLLGFFGKFLLFGSAIAAGHLWLALMGILNSAIALYYYVNLIRLMYLVAPAASRPLRLDPALGAVLAVCVLATVVMGLFPGPLLQWVDGRAIAQWL